MISDLNLPSYHRWVIYWANRSREIISTLAFFRIIEPALGRIIIDNVGIGTVGLHEIKSELTIIPREGYFLTDRRREIISTLALFGILL